ncbi:MAG: YihA family ribosome biogenesis GTP-binding protein [Clostridium sp.]|jgi:GTP-binding protein|nr:YihA family ribosome biogenesis GTP-binding protein [Clostridium sp.]
MVINKSEFLTSAVKRDQYPEEDLPEVAFIGRSNVGKSSIINSLTNRRGLARVSNTPGRTRLANFFVINDEIYLVDLPGYGYAKVSKKEKENLGKINEEYFSSRANLNKVVLLVDSRHKPNQDDVIMYEYIRHFGIPCLVVGTKLDKLKRNEVKRNEKMIRETLGMIPEDQIILYSSLTRENRDKVLEAVFSDLTIEQEL